MDTTISYAALEQLKYTIDEDPALEAYNTVHRILDTFGRILSNINTNFTHFNKKFKRSELKFFHNSKVLGLKNLYKTRYFDPNLSIPIPSGMKVSYLQAVETIVKLFKQINIAETLYHLERFQKFADINIDDVIKDINKVTKDQVQDDLRTIFSSDKTMEVPLSKVITNLNQVKEIDNYILEYETIFQKVPEYQLKINNIEKNIDILITDMEHNKARLDHNYVRKLHELVSVTAVQIDMFGVVLAEAQRIEHNFVIVLQRLVQAAATH